MFTEQHADSAIDSFFSLCACFVCGGRWEPPRAEDELRRLWGLLECHSLTPILFHCIDDLESNLPEDRVSELRMRRLGQAARNAIAVHQLEEIARAFGERGIPVIALKGAAAILWLYDDIACRTITDLDLLVPPWAVKDAEQIMAQLGYSQEQGRTPPNSPEFEEIEKLQRLERGQHLRPFVRPGFFSVEIHTNFLKRRKKRYIAQSEIWNRTVALTPDIPNLYRLSTIDFLLHAIVHYPQHLESGIPPLKFLMDIALAVRKEGDQIDWNEFWNTAERWDITSVAATVMATVGHNWNLNIPNLPKDALTLNADTLIGGAVPLHLRELMAPEGLYYRKGHPIADVFRRYWNRVSLAGALSNRSSRFRYLFHILFPVPENMRHRYKIPEGRPVAPYYLIHPFVLVKNFFVGLASAVRTSRTRRLR